MSLANMQRNILNSVRDKNFQLCHERGWSVEEREHYINLYDRKHQIIDKFYGHIALSKYLNN